MSEAPRGGSGLLAGLFLPFLLSLLPLLLLIPGARQENERQRAQLQERWRDRTDRLARRLVTFSKPDSWVELFLRRAVAGSEQALAILHPAGRGPEPTPAVLGTVLAHARRRARFPGMPRSRIWAVPLSADGGDLLRGVGLESDLRYVMARLLREVGRNGTGGPPDFEGGKWSRLLEQLFGYGVSGDLFMGEMQGRAFPVIFQGKSRTACWDILSLRGKPLAAVLTVSDLRADQVRVALRLAMRNWTKLEPAGAAAPAILPLPRGAGRKAPSILLSPRLRGSSGARRLLTSIRDGMRVIPGQEELWARVIEDPEPSLPANEGFHQALARKRALGEGVSGRIRLPVDGIGRVLSDADERCWYRLFPLSPTSMSLGCLVSSTPRTPAGPISRAAKTWSLAVGGFWVAVLLCRLILGFLPALGVRATLILWFLGLVALPVSLALVTGAGFFADLRRNLLDDGFAQLDRLLQDLENSRPGLARECLQVSRNLFDRGTGGMDVPGELYRIQFEGCPADPLFDRAWNHFASAGFDLTGFLAFGHRKFLQARFSAATPRQTAAGMQYLTRNLAQPFLNQVLTPAQKERGIKPEETLLARGNDSSGVSGLKEGELSQLEIGPKKLFLYFDRLRHRGEVWHFILILWDQDRLFGDWLQRRVRACRMASGQGLAVFRPGRDSVGIISATGDAAGLKAWVPGNDLGEIRRETADRLVLSRSSRAFSGFRFVATISTGWIRDRLRQEQKRLFLQLLLLVGMVGLAGWLLSAWLARPIEGMTHGLQQVAAGNLAGHLGIVRNDELGKAATALDTMTDWLRQRVKMSRFVAPQVLDVVAGGHLANLRRGAARDVMMLVSDIRGFTTMTETRSPEEIFSLLNGHLERMTRAIRDAGGSIDRFIGDAIQAVFSVSGATPEDRANAARQALAAARNMNAEHRRFNAERIAAGSFPYEIGIGIDGGPVVTGVLGDPESRLDFTVLGEPVQHAGEFEAASKQGRSTRIVCSEAIRRLLPHESWLEMPSAEMGWELAEGVFPAGEGGGRQAAILPGRTDESMAAQPPLEQEAGRSECRAHDERNGGRIGRTVVPVILWALPLMLIGATWTTLQEEFSRKCREREQSLLNADLKLLSKTLRPDVQLAMMLHREIDALPERTPGVGSASEITARAGQLFSRMRSLVPSLGWVILKPREPFVSPRREVGFTDWLGTEQRTDAVFPASEAAPLFALCSSDQLHGRVSYDTDLDRFVDRMIPQMFGSAGQKSFLLQRQAFRQWVEVTIHGAPRLLYWDFLRRLPAWECDRGAPFPPLADGVRGGFLLTLDPADLTPALTRRLLTDNFRARGTILELPTAAGPARGAVDPSLVEKRVTIDLEGPLAVSASRRIVAVTPLNGWGRGLGIAGALWVLFILAWIRGPDRLPLGLSGRLAGAFVGVLLPAVLFAGLLAERRQLERESRLEGDLLQGLEARAACFDEGFPVWKSAHGAILNGELNDSRMRSELVGLDRATGPVSAGESGGGELLRRLQKRLARNGIHLGISHLVSRKGRDWGLSDSKGRDRHDPIQDFQNLISRRLLGALNPGLIRVGGKDAENQELLLAVELDELTGALRIFLDPSTFAGMFLSPFSIERYSNAQIASTIFVRHLRLGEKPAFLFQVPWDDDTELFHHLANFRRFLAPPLPGKTGIGVGLAREAFTLFPDPPFQVEAVAPPALIDLVEGSRAMDPRPGTTNFLAAVTGEPVVGHIGVGDGETLFLSRSSRSVVGMNLFGSATLGQERALARARLSEDRFWLLAILLFTFLLARLVAGRFISPLLRLTAGTERIMAGDFAIRLPVEREDEFGRLARAFNAMALGIEEGRLLSRFVSEEVRRTARDEKEEAVARRGEAVPAVVLFAGLSRFKQLLSEVPPERLIESLNRYLETMSREIRGQGGMIDKFIGDKILAVFFVRDHGGEAASMAAALRASGHMLERMDALAGDLASPLGIGLTAGTVLAGIMGTADVRLESTVIGDPVNLASRLCDIARARERGGIVVEAAVVEALRCSGDAGTADWAGRAVRLETTRVKGRHREVEIYLWPRKAE